MSSITAQAPEVFSAREIARAAGVSPRAVTALIQSGALKTIDGCYVRPAEAVRTVRLLRGSSSAPEVDPSAAPTARELFRPHPADQRTAGRALVASGVLHAGMFAGLLFVATLGVTASRAPQAAPAQARMVFLPTPGPGGGGGGGGVKQSAPPAVAKLEGVSSLRSPVPPRRVVAKRPEPRVVRTPPPPPVRPKPVEHPVEPPVAAAPVPLPQVVAPVATAAADPEDQAGVLAAPAADTNSGGSGTGGGAGAGRGSGIGEGDGAGIGPGSGGGTGGGPYRAGSGISPPAIVREVKPDYTEDARRRGIEGDVVLEIVVRRDGTVGPITLLQGLGAGLDQRAIDAVRQWRFSPALRQGTPVDVMVEVAVEFSLR